MRLPVDNCGQMSAAASAGHFHHAYTEQAAEANAAVARIACAAAERRRHPRD